MKVDTGYEQIEIKLINPQERFNNPTQEYINKYQPFSLGENMTLGGQRETRIQKS
jgi:hypothetical protein